VPPRAGHHVYTSAAAGWGTGGCQVGGVWVRYGVVRVWVRYGYGMGGTGTGSTGPVLGEPGPG